MTAARRTIRVLTLVMLAGLSAPHPAQTAAGQIAGAPLVYLRTGPGPTYQPVDVLSEGTPLETLAVDGAWTKVVLEDGREGYVYSTFIEELADPVPTPEPEPAAEVSPLPPGPDTAPEAPPDAPAGLVSDDPPPPTPDPFLLEEVARLRTEIDSLKRTVSDELTAEGTARDSSGDSAGEADAGLQTVGIALVMLAVGWFFGAWYGRRRAQRSRLRF